MELSAWETSRATAHHWQKRKRGHSVGMAPFALRRLQGWKRAVSSKAETGKRWLQKGSQSGGTHRDGCLCVSLVSIGFSESLCNVTAAASLTN